MASAFDRWEKDPFFSAAEEVQESADRMESTYRTWIHAAKENSGVWNLDELRRSLQTALGTTRWQLEEFVGAVSLSYLHGNAVKDAKERHQNFIVAIENQVEKVESCLNKLPVMYGKPPSPWARLDEGERNELAMFLSGPPSSSSRTSGNFSVDGHGMKNSGGVYRNGMDECSRSSSHLNELDHLGGVPEKLPGHRRTASANLELSSWKISVSDEPRSNTQPDLQPCDIPGLSGFLNTLESSVSLLKWPYNGYKKIKVIDLHQGADTAALPKSQNMNRGINICNEKNKNGYGSYYFKKLQRSQHQIKCSKLVQVVFSIAVICFLVLLVIHTF